MKTQFNEVESEEDMLGLGFSFNRKDYSFSSINEKNESVDSTSGTYLSLTFGIDASKVSY